MAHRLRFSLWSLGIALVAFGLLPGMEIRAAAPSHPVIITVDARLDARRGSPEARSVATLDEALALVIRLRQRWPDRTMIVELLPGIHRVLHPLRIGPEHSGPDSPRLIIRGASGHRSIVTGSIALNPAPTVLDRTLAARLPDIAKGHVRAYRLPETALLLPRIQRPKLLRTPPDALTLDVFDRDGELAPARWPAEGWAKVATGTTNTADPSFAVDADRLARWRAEPDLWAEGYWRWNWLFESLPVAGVDPERKSLRLAELPYEGILAGARFRVSHALSELGEPGEWWRDRADGLLIAWPRPHAETLDVAVTDTLFAIDGASHVEIEGLTLERSRGDLVTVHGGSDIVIRDSRLAWAGGRGAVFSATRDGGLDNCDIEDIGRVAVRLDGGDRASLTPGGLFLRNSRVTRFALRSRTQSPAVEIDGVGALVSGNTIHDSGDAAFHIHGNDHRIVDNEIAHLLMGTSDDGAIYAGRDWTAQGTLIQGNYLHDIRADAGFEVKGIYLDDFASGFMVKDNLFLRVDQPVFIGGGRNNLVEGNIFVASSPGIHVDSRGETWAKASIDDAASELRTAYAAMPVASALWTSRYPALAGILLDHPAVAKDNRIVGNLFALGQDLEFNDGGQAAEQTIRDNVGPANMRLLSGADLPALALHSLVPADFSSLADEHGRGPEIGAMRRAVTAQTSNGPDR